MYALKTSYIVITIPCASGVVNIINISQKIPQDFVVIDGCRATVRSRFFTTPATLPNCTYSLSFNNKTSNPIVEDADKSSKLSKKGPKYFNLLEPAQGGTYVQGYIETSINAEVFFITITLRGKKLLKK